MIIFSLTRLTPSLEELRRSQQEAISCLQRAMDHYRIVIDDINQQTEKKQKKSWRVKRKQACEKDLATCKQWMKTLEEDSLLKSRPFCEESAQKTHQAHDLYQNHHIPPSYEEKIRRLQEAAKLYEEAAALEGQALSHIDLLSLEERKTLLKNNQKTCLSNATHCKESSTSLLEQAVSQRKRTSQSLEELEKDLTLFQEKGLIYSVAEIQQQKASFLQKLIDLGDPEAKERLTKLQEEGHVHPALGKLSVTSLERFLKKFPKKT
jgi:hypothetical protein